MKSAALCVLALGISLLTVGAGQLAAQSTLQLERFDRDPQWDGLHNRLLPDFPHQVRQAFGWSSSHRAGGKTAGEIGGRVQRSLTRARYAIKLDQPLTLDSPMEVSGQCSVTSADGGSGALIGWFNETSDGWRTPNAMAIRIDGNGGKYWVFHDHASRHGYTGGIGAFAGERYQTTSTAPFAADGTPHRWSLRYDPRAGGSGQVTLTIDGRTYVTDVDQRTRQDGAVFDHFGIWNQQTTGNALECWFDDLNVNGRLLTFDTDPNWIGQGNRAEFVDRFVRPNHNYGFSPTRFVGGGAGELGGILWRDERPSYYGAHTDPLTLQHHLDASGRFTLRRAGPDSGVYLGWFRSKSKAAQRGTDLRNFVGVLIEGPSRDGHYFRPSYRAATGGGRDLPQGPIVRPDQTVHQWSIHYAPDAANRTGVIRATLDGHTANLVIEPPDFAVGATFDRFGLLNIQSGGWHVEIYFDDVSYTGRRDRRGN